VERSHSSPQKSDLKSFSRNAIAYSGRFAIAHLLIKKRSLSRKEKVIAFVQSLRSAIAPQSPIIKVIALQLTAS
jgi:hypothetical protein